MRTALINLSMHPSDSSGKLNGKLGPMNPTKLALYDFVRNLFSEIVQVFPDQYFHLGGDEVPFDCWASNPEIIAYMNAHNMSKKFELLENEYVAKVLAIIKSLDTNTIVWQEVSLLAISTLSTCPLPSLPTTDRPFALSALFALIFTIHPPSEF